MLKFLSNIQHPQNKMAILREKKILFVLSLLDMCYWLSQNDFFSLFLFTSCPWIILSPCRWKIIPTTKKNKLWACIRLCFFYPSRRLRPLDSAGSWRKEAGKSPDPAGKHRKFVGFFSGGFQSISCGFQQEPVGILLPRFGDFRCFPAGTGP